MALKSEFDNTSYWIVLTRSLTGAVLGAVPGALYVFNTQQNAVANPFGMSLIQTGSMIGALTLGLAALAGTTVAALKNRTGSGTMRKDKLKEYLHPNTLPVIPPVTKTTDKTTDQPDRQQPVIPTIPVSVSNMPEVDAKPAEPSPQHPPFENFDR